MVQQFHWDNTFFQPQCIGHLALNHWFQWSWVYSCATSHFPDMKFSPLIDFNERVPGLGRVPSVTWIQVRIFRTSVDLDWSILVVYKKLKPQDQWLRQSYCNHLQHWQLPFADQPATTGAWEWRRGSGRCRPVSTFWSAGEMRMNLDESGTCNLSSNDSSKNPT